ncbi:MAG: PIN domain-containing protein [Euryarchaeota archaeon]|nr:PIN domain-containing protein [Euryarchaeota archaeon]
MPVVDTEVLFGLSPADRRHAAVLALLARRQGLEAPDVALLEFAEVLRGRGRPLGVVARALRLLRVEMEERGLGFARTLDAETLAHGAEIEEAHRLTFFDALVAAAALARDGHLVSDDGAFDRVPGLVRIPLSAR